MEMNKSERDKVGEAGRARAVSCFSSSKMCEETYRIYADV